MHRTGKRLPAVRGTAYHKAFELLKRSEIKNRSDAEAYLKRLYEEDQLTEEAVKLVRADDILKFAQSELAKRMEAADKRGNLFREQPFIIARNAETIDKSWPQDETVQIQGIIDAFFIEDEKINLVDYKTDRGVDEETLLKRYKVQLDLYADALKSIFGLEIAEKIIYSVYLKKELVI